MSEILHTLKKWVVVTSTILPTLHHYENVCSSSFSEKKKIWIISEI